MYVQWLKNVFLAVCAILTGSLSLHWNNKAKKTGEWSSIINRWIISYLECTKVLPGRRWLIESICNWGWGTERSRKRFFFLSHVIWKKKKSFLFPLLSLIEPLLGVYNRRKRCTQEASTRYLLAATYRGTFFLFPLGDDDGPDRLENRSFLFQPLAAPPISCPFFIFRIKKRNPGRQMDYCVWLYDFPV